MQAQLTLATPKPVLQKEGRRGQRQRQQQKASTSAKQRGRTKKDTIRKGDKKQMNSIEKCFFLFLQEQIKPTLAKSVRDKCYKAKEKVKEEFHTETEEEKTAASKGERVESCGEKQAGPTADARPRKAQGRTPPLSVARPLRYLSGCLLGPCIHLPSFSISYSYSDFPFPFLPFLDSRRVFRLYSICVFLWWWFIREKNLEEAQVSSSWNVVMFLFS